MDPIPACQSVAVPVAAVSRGTDADASRTQTIRALRELIAAIDRRAPQIGRAGETAIANAAAVLKNEALRRLTELEREEVGERGAVPVGERPTHEVA